MLIEINVGGEAAKSGIAARIRAELEHILNAAPEWKNLRIRGLMTVPPFTEDPEGARPYFRQLRELRDRLAARDLAVCQLRCALDGHVARLRSRNRRRFDLRAHRHGDLWNAQRNRDPDPRHAAGATFYVKVHPRAKKNAITGEVGDALKVALTAPPVEGRANEACIALLAEVLNVPRSSVTIAAGETSRNKVIRVRGLSAAQIEEKLQAALGKPPTRQTL